MLEVRELADESGHSPYRKWFEELHGDAAVKVSTAIYRLSMGNFSNIKGVGAGVFECRINFGPGYRVYFGKQGDQIIILVGLEQKRLRRPISLTLYGSGGATRREGSRHGADSRFQSDGS